MTNNSPDRLDRIEAIVETTAMAMREMQVKQDRMQEQQDRMQEQQERMEQQQARMQQQIDQRFNELGDFIGAVSNDVAQLAQNQEQQNIRMAQLTANVESLVNALQNRFAGNGGG